MSIDISSIGSVGPSAAPSGPRRTPPASTAAFDAVATSDGRIPSSPPPEVLDAVGRAAARHQELHAQGLELGFRDGPEGVGVELRDLEGNVLRTLAPSELLDVATGGSVA